jgi:hypothetical protein
VIALKEALEELSRKGMPLEWAKAHGAIGLALLKLGERSPGTELLKEAIAAFDKAFEELTCDRDPPSWARTSAHLGAAQFHLAKRTGDAALAGTALVTLRAAAFVLSVGEGFIDTEQTAQRLIPAAEALVARLSR